jgi:hypothetical protein|tara:strand:- start:139 stop:267 length:129 start_codon:yes stop_codon:yes gene_type:complete
MKLTLSLALNSIVTGAAARILNLWNKLSRDWGSEGRDWDNIT